MNLNNKILYADMINSMNLGADILYEDEHALFICDHHSSILYATADTLESASKMITVLPENFDILVTHDTFTNIALEKQKGYVHENECFHCAYLSKELFTVEVPSGYELKRVTRAYMKDVIALYAKEMPELANEDYMGLTMDAGMLGVFDQDILCGFIGVHEGGYGSIGMLEVDERYRRRGIALVLEKAMINEQIKRGRIPYGEIFTGNITSIKLQEHVGMEIGKDVTFWFYR